MWYNLNLFNVICFCLIVRTDFLNRGGGNLKSNYHLPPFRNYIKMTLFKM